MEKPTNKPVSKKVDLTKPHKFIDHTPWYGPDECKCGLPRDNPLHINKTNMTTEKKPTNKPVKTERGIKIKLRKYYDSLGLIWDELDKEIKAEKSGTQKAFLEGMQYQLTNEECGIQEILGIRYKKLKSGKLIEI